MTYFIIPGMALAMLFMAGACALPFMALRDKHLAVINKRALFEKSAGQITVLAFWLQFLTAMALWADKLAGGGINAFAVGSLSVFWLALLITWSGAVLCSLLAWVMVRKKNRAAHSVCLWLAGILALLGSGAGVALVLAFLRFVRLIPGLTEQTDLWNILPALRGTGAYLPYLFCLTAVALGYAAGHGFSLVWYILRRKKDDFGRDYYSLIIGYKARKASFGAGIFLIPLTLIALGLTWGLPAERLAMILPLPLDTARLIAGLAGLGLPVAVFCWHVVGRAALPLRKKYLIFPPLIFLWAWLCSWLGSLWL